MIVKISILTISLNCCKFFIAYILFMFEFTGRYSRRNLIIIDSDLKVILCTAALAHDTIDTDFLEKYRIVIGNTHYLCTSTESPWVYNRSIHFKGKICPTWHNTTCKWTNGNVNFKYSFLLCFNLCLNDFFKCQ